MSRSCKTCRCINQDCVNRASYTHEQRHATAQTSSMSELMRSRRCFSIVLWLVSFGAPAQQHGHMITNQAVRRWVFMPQPHDVHSPAS
jgi:hypothetical protein